MTNKYYNLNFYKTHLKLEITSLPIDDFNRNELYYNLILYFELSDIIIRHKNKIFNNEKELKLFFESHKNGIELKDVYKIYVTIV